MAGTGVLFRRNTKGILETLPPLEGEIVFATDTGEHGWLNSRSEIVWSNLGDAFKPDENNNIAIGLDARAGLITQYYQESYDQYNIPYDQKLHVTSAAPNGVMILTQEIMLAPTEQLFIMASSGLDASVSTQDIVVNIYNVEQVNAELSYNQSFDYNFKVNTDFGENTYEWSEQGIVTNDSETNKTYVLVFQGLDDPVNELYFCISKVEKKNGLAVVEYNLAANIIEKDLTTSNNIAVGLNVDASGKNSQAFGHDTLALGVSSHAEGYNTKALGFASHAEGKGNEAIGYGSHAEGENSSSSSSSSSSSGTGGSYSDQKFSPTKAGGKASHTVVALEDNTMGSCIQALRDDETDEIISTLAH